MIATGLLYKDVFTERVHVNRSELAIEIQSALGQMLQCAMGINSCNIKNVSRLYESACSDISMRSGSLPQLQTDKLTLRGHSPSGTHEVSVLLL